MAGLLADGDAFAFLRIVAELAGAELDPELDVGVLHDVGRLEQRFGATDVVLTWSPGSPTIAWEVTGELELAAQGIARALNGDADPALPPLLRPARNDERHYAATTRRWGFEYHDEPCGRCRFWIPLSGTWGGEWGVCSCADSPNDRRATFEDDGCAAFAPGGLGEPFFA